MANMYDTPANCSSFSPPETTDDISLFLRQILFKSSSSSSSSPSLAAKQVQPAHSSIADRIPTLSTPCGANFPANAAAYVSSSSVGTIENDPDDYDCESEEGFENLMEEMVAKQNPPRSSSKRSRAAEVHNLSEKRRRNRINEKMKALQKLIPNSNKTDKASMLDEAIEYLKQLQLQVQMLTMRNGLNLYSMCVPTEIHEQNQLPLNPERNLAAFPVNQETLVNPMLSLPTGRSQPSVLDFSPKPSSRLESSFGIQHGSFHLPNSSKEFCRDAILSCPQTHVNNGSNSFGHR